MRADFSVSNQNSQKEVNRYSKILHQARITQSKEKLFLSYSNMMLLFDYF